VGSGQSIARGGGHFRHSPKASTVHSLTQEALNAGILHSSKDRRSALKGDDYYQTYRLVAAYIAYLERFLSAPAEKPR
jgi:hypothetical protein